MLSCKSVTGRKIWRKKKEKETEKEKGQWYMSPFLEMSLWTSMEYGKTIWYPHALHKSGMCALSTYMCFEHESPLCPGNFEILVFILKHSTNGRRQLSPYCAVASQSLFLHLLVFGCPVVGQSVLITVLSCSASRPRLGTGCLFLLPSQKPTAV